MTHFLIALILVQRIFAPFSEICPEGITERECYEEIYYELQEGVMKMMRVVGGPHEALTPTQGMNAVNTERSEATDD